MTSILPTSLFSGRYYNVPASSGSADTTTSQAGGISGLSPSKAVAHLLYQANTRARESGSDVIRLSSTANNYLSKRLGVSDPNTSFVLTGAQSQKLTGILQQFKNAPNTQETFNKIQEALKTAGLSPDQLAARDVKNSSSVSLETVRTLNGNASSPTTLANEQTKANNYIGKVYGQYQRIATQKTTTGTTA